MARCTLLLGCLGPGLASAQEAAATDAAGVTGDGQVLLPSPPETMPLVGMYPSPLVWSPDARAVLYARAPASGAGLRIYRLEYALSRSLTSTLLVDDPRATAPSRLFALQQGVVACFNQQGLALIEAPGTPRARLRLVCASARQPLASVDGRWLAYLQPLPQDQAHGDTEQLHLLSAAGSDQVIALATPPALGKRSVVYLTSWDQQQLHLSYGICTREQPGGFADPKPWICDAQSASCHPDHEPMRFAIGSDPGGPRSAWPLRWTLPAGRILTSPQADQPQPHLEPPVSFRGLPQAATRLSAQLILASQPGQSAPLSLAGGPAAAAGDLLPRAVDASGLWILSAIFHT